MLQAGQEILPYMLYLPPWVWDEATVGRSAGDSMKNRTCFKYPDPESSPVTMTTTNPSNTSEWQLYRVLQRANLLQYYDVFIAQGGDDVQQLCEAGEEEFLEIMALVGMASKPLHVRRLQKSLQEWVTNPAGFQGPMVPMGGSSSPAPGSISATVRDQALTYPVHSSSVVTAPTWTPQMPPASVSPTNSNGSSGASPKSDLKDDTAMIGMLYQSASQDGMPITPKQSTSPVPTPVLVESQIQAIADAAERLAKDLPSFEPKGLNLKKSINREIQAVVNMTEDDPCRMDELRKYAAIYGRFDSKRKNDKPMSLHEISVNEASAQLCKHIPALLTRREDLFPLARQVVRDSGYQYSKGHSRGSNEPPSIKKMKMDPVFLRLYDNSQKTVKAELDKIHREERMTVIHSELAQISTAQEDLKSRIQLAKDSQDYTLVHNVQAQLETLMSRQVQLLSEQNDLVVKQQKYEKYIQMISKGAVGNIYGDDDYADSSNLPSGASSPQNSLHDGDDFDGAKAEVYTLTPRRNAQKTKQLVKETLFDEGLRIAQQYGMADFAEEIIGLKQHTVGDEDEEVSPASRAHASRGARMENSQLGIRVEAANKPWPNGSSGSKDRDAEVEETSKADVSKLESQGNGSVNGEKEGTSSVSSSSSHDGADDPPPQEEASEEEEEEEAEVLEMVVSDEQTNKQTDRHSENKLPPGSNGLAHRETSTLPSGSTSKACSNVARGQSSFISSDSSLTYRNIDGLSPCGPQDFKQTQVTYSQ
ncbi:uncharacterized protein LOC135462023 isoform X2 [Liolophura sinensis]|uniref:uncharacterized protein LOC135462023 isoform X2 n=1 Tax=Liolophura sinensis TaxID=3198878 RepID=UPI0031580E48